MASVVAVVSVALTVYLVRVALWAAAAFLVVEIFLSFALRAWSVRAGSLAAIGALTTFVASGGHISVDRIVWFMAASTIGFAWLAIWQRVIVPDRPAHVARRSILVLGRLAADVVAAAALATNPANAAYAPNTLRTSLERVIACRRTVDDQLAALIPHVDGNVPIEELRVMLYSTQAALERLVDHVDQPQWPATVSDALATSISGLLKHLAEALIVPTNAPGLGEVAGEMQQLRAYLDELALEPMTGDEERRHRKAAPTIVATLGAADLVIESVSRAAALEGQARSVLTETIPDVTTIDRPVPPPRITGLRPTTALAVQAVVASVSAGLIALWVGIEQSRVVAYTAFLVIATSAGSSLRRAWTRVVATAVGATAGVVIAASVPRNPIFIGVVVVVGMFFTVFTAPVSNAAMVFWLSIATVPLAATEGMYLDLVKDKTIAALLAGCVAAVVVLTVLPIRLSESIRPAMLTYLDALDVALLALVPTHRDVDLRPATELDRAHSAFGATAASAADETQPFSQPDRVLAEQRLRIDAVHDAYLRLAPLLDDTSMRVLGWTRDDVDDVVGQLLVAVEATKSAIRGDPAAGASAGPMTASSLRLPEPAGDSELELAGQRQCIDNLNSTLTELARHSAEHRGRPSRPTAGRCNGQAGCELGLPRSTIQAVLGR